MSHKTALKLYEWASYILILGATVLYFVLRERGIALTLVVLVLAVFMRLMMERTRRKACEDEITELQDDLRRLTRLLAESKKKLDSMSKEK
ncbi:MAG: hypothetical protein IJ764_05610 [Bacteroidales bacterium]|nr:hypothetical protein [Bacteroidales bacterium]